MKFTRRTLVLSAGLGLLPRLAWGFGSVGVFRPRWLAVGKAELGVRLPGLQRWSLELARRAGAPINPDVARVAASSSDLCAEPFVIWAGASDVGNLSRAERTNLERFLRLGGLLVVDDSDPAKGEFGRSVKRELFRILPDAAPLVLESNHVLFKSFYLLDRAVGRAGSRALEAIVRGRHVQVLFLSIDMLGALASDDGDSALAFEPGENTEREQALRFSINLAMYLLCSDYKDDQVHAAWRMRRRGRSSRK